MNKSISMLILIAVLSLSNSITHAQAQEFVWVVAGGVGRI